MFEYVCFVLQQFFLTFLLAHFQSSSHHSPKNMNKTRILLNCLGAESQELASKGILRQGNQGRHLSNDELKELCCTYRKRLVADDEGISEFDRHRKRFRISMEQSHINVR
jgi:hypothetical protein